MRTLGVDLAADPRKTAACLIDWSRLTVEVTTPATDEDLVGLVGSVDLTGIDVPLGWPDEFVAAITEHHAGRSWPVADSSSVAGRERLRHRRTDVALRQAGDRPLSVSTDLIGVVALRAAGLQQRFLDAGLEVDRSGLSGSVAEVYPAAALRFWELPSRGYKGAAHAEERHAIVGLVLTETGNLTRAAELALDGCTDHVLDAFVASVVAKAVLVGKTTSPGPADGEAASREGWIHVPTASLADIVSATPG